MSKNRKLIKMKRPGPLFTKTIKDKDLDNTKNSLSDPYYGFPDEKEMSTPMVKSVGHDQILTVKITGANRVAEHETESSDQSSSSSESEVNEANGLDHQKLDKVFDENREFKKAKRARHKPLYINNEGGEKTLYCHYCKEYFNRTPDHPNNFANHIRLVHADINENGTFTCRHCSHITKDKIALRRHFNTHRILADPRVCQNCGETFPNYRDWRSHCKRHQKVKRSFGCYLCGNTYTSKPSLICHLISLHKQLGRKCKYCNKSILFEKWDAHEMMEKESHKEQIVVICEICAQTFTSKESAANHRRNFQ